MSMNRVVSLLRKIIFKTRIVFSNEYTRGKVYVDFLDVNIGENSVITGEVSFGSEPYLINIGNNVRITHGVMFHTHDGGVGIFRAKYPGINIIKGITVGNNVFIGSHVTIMPGVTIGNNVVIGASSVVTRDIPDNGVYAGVPAKFIKTLADYEEKALTEAIYLKSASHAKNRKEEILSHLAAKKLIIK